MCASTCRRKASRRTTDLQQLAPYTRAGDLAQLVGERQHNFIIRLKAGSEFHTHLGIIKHEALIGIPWGSQVNTHLDKAFLVLQPALDDLLRQIKRETQIMYPKDIGYLLVTMGIGPGSSVIEAGCGSGALTTALAYTVGPQGHVYSYERKEKNLEITRANLVQFGLEKRVTLTLRDISEGFDQQDINAVFLDLPDPYNYIPQVRQALLPGGFFGSLLPTTNQVSDLITALKHNSFGFLEVSEILHRYYKPVANRLRPMDKMVAHTGYLVFARCAAQLSETSAAEE